MDYSHYCRSTAKYIFVARDEIGYLDHLATAVINGDLPPASGLASYGITDEDIEKIAFDDDELLMLVSVNHDSDVHASTISKQRERPYALAKVVNLTLLFASRHGRPIKTNAISEISEKLILKIGEMMGALYVEYQLGMDAPTELKMLDNSADFRFEANDEELEERRKHNADVSSRLVELIARLDSL